LAGASPDPVAGFKGSEKEEKGGKGREGKRSEERGEEEGRRGAPALRWYGPPEWLIRPCTN